jgi:tetratricopeptide (TPR) repeat protein
MMRRFWISLALLAAAGGAWLWFAGRAPEWTSHSSAALDAFHQGLEAEMKYYSEDARRHFARALELDPNFMMAKLKLLNHLPYGEKERMETLVEELRQVDTGSLNERERFLLAYRLARADREHAHAERTLAAYLEQHPEDPYALWIRCTQSWARQDLAEAEACYGKLLKVDPNWVQAQNHLGYTAMAQGRFAQAEELFRTYLYVAPDQANPHDSLGELYTLLGRYDDAERQLDEALRVRPDFCAAWEHLVAVANLRGDPERAAAALRRLEELGACSKQFVKGQRCRVALWGGAASQDWNAAWRDFTDLGCGGEGVEGTLALAYRAALYSGHQEESRAMEEKLRQHAELYGSEERGAVAALAHLEGLRQLADGDSEAAAARLRAADDVLAYWGNGEGVFKLINRLDLALALERAGDAAGAERLRAEVASVNPALAARHPAAAAGGAAER